MNKPSISIAVIIVLTLLYGSISAQLPQSSWSQVSPMSGTRSHHVTAGWEDNGTRYIFIIGGRYNGNTTAKNTRYNTATDSYSEMAPLPEPLERSAGFVLGDSIYVAGGSGGILNLFKNKVYKYDINSNSWEQKNNLPLLIGEITSASASYNNRYAYIAGGFNGIVALNNVYSYDSHTDTWSLATPLPIVGLFNMSLSLLNDSTLFASGGRSLISLSALTFKGKISQANPLSILWTPSVPFPGGGIYGLSSWSSGGGKVFFTGGSRTLISDGMVSSSSSETYLYNDRKASYDTLGDKPTPVNHTQIYGYDNPQGGGMSEYKIYAPGGTNNSGNGINNNEVLTVLDSSDNTVTIIKINEQIPGSYNLKQNYPNPFNPSTKIEFSIPERGDVSIIIVDFLGREVNSVFYNSLPAGNYAYNFTQSNLSAGIYFYRMSVSGNTITKKMMLVK